MVWRREVQGKGRGAKAREVSGVGGHRRFGPGVGGLHFRRMGPSRSWAK